MRCRQLRPERELQVACGTSWARLFRIPTITLLLDFSRDAHHQRDKPGQCERKRKQRERNHREHDQSPLGRPHPQRLMEGNMANRGGGRCDGHHKIVECIGPLGTKMRGGIVRKPIDP